MPLELGLLPDDLRLLAELAEPLDRFEAWLARAGFFDFADLDFDFVELALAFDLFFFGAVLVSAICLSSSCGFPPNPSSSPIR